MGRLTDPASKSPTDAMPETTAWDSPALGATTNAIVPYMCDQWECTGRTTYKMATGVVIPTLW